MRWVGHVARMGDRRGAHRVLVAKSWEDYSLEEPGVDGRIILKWILDKWYEAWTGSM